MDKVTIKRCQQLIGYHFADTGLLATALTHSSAAPTRLQSNERLEFLGDAVLGLIVCQELYESYKLAEGEMTKIKSAVVSRQTCADIAIEAGICDLLFHGRGMKSLDGLPRSVCAAAFETIIGAIYIDGGLAPARQFVMGHVKEHIDEALANEHQRNYKSLLQQHAQRTWNTTPDYLLLDEKGPDHSKAFEVAVSLSGRSFPSGWGKTKKEAEQVAAQRALCAMGLLKDQDDTGECEQA